MTGLTVALSNYQHLVHKSAFEEMMASAAESSRSSEPISEITESHFGGGCQELTGTPAARSPVFLSPPWGGSRRMDQPESQQEAAFIG